MTSSGLDPSELFDDVEDQVPYPVENNQIDDDVMSCESDSHLIPRVKSDHSFNLNLGTKPEEISLYTTPSLYSLISVHDDIDNIRGIKKGVSTLLQLWQIILFCLYRIWLMCYRKRRDPMEQFLTKCT